MQCPLQPPRSVANRVPQGMSALNLISSQCHVVAPAEFKTGIGHLCESETGRFHGGGRDPSHEPCSREFTNSRLSESWPGTLHEVYLSRFHPRSMPCSHAATRGVTGPRRIPNGLEHPESAPLRSWSGMTQRRGAAAIGSSETSSHGQEAGEKKTSQGSQRYGQSHVTS
jgi:hypothetical protein